MFETLNGLAAMLSPRDHNGRYVSADTYAGLQILRAAGVDRPSPIVQQASGFIFTSAIALAGLAISQIAKRVR